MNVCVQNDEMDSLQAVNVIQFFFPHPRLHGGRATHLLLEKVGFSGVWVAATHVPVGFLYTRTPHWPGDHLGTLSLNTGATGLQKPSLSNHFASPVLPCHCCLFPPLLVLRMRNEYVEQIEIKFPTVTLEATAK